MNGVTNTSVRMSKGSPVQIHTVDFHKFPKQLRDLKPWEYLKASSDEKLTVSAQAGLQSVFHTASVLREQRVLATKSMTLGHVIWRKILWMMKHQTYLIRSTHKWYRAPFLYLKYKYLRYCIKEILLVRDKVFNQFGFSYADLRMDPGMKPKASFLKSFRTKELLFESDSLSMTEELRISHREYALTHESEIHELRGNFVTA
jgi:hypothetical protein